MEKYLITIIIPVFNNPSIRRALQSVIDNVDRSQTEIIVADGNSTDETKEIVTQFGNAVDLFISEQDSGPYDAANKGIQRATGEWFLWLSADDELLVDPKEIIKRYGTKEIDVLCGSVLEEKEDGTYLTVKSEDNLKRLKYHCSLRQPATLFRKEKVINVGMYDINYHYAADRELFLRLMTRDARFRIVSDSIVRFHYGGLTTSKKVVESYEEDYKISLQYGASKALAKSLYEARKAMYLLKNRK